MYSKNILKTHKGAGVNPAGYDVPLIYRDPPAAIFTRKKETVDIGDVQYMLRADNPNGDPSRINEAISVYGKGRNPMVKVDYGAGRGASAPYKIEVVRPPLMPIETLNSISAPRCHQNYAIQTNPSIFPLSLSSFFDKDRVNQVARVERNSGLIRSNPSLYTTTTQDVYNRENYKDAASIDEINPYSVMSNVNVNGGKTISGEFDKNNLKDNILKQLNTNFSSIIIYDPKTNSSIDVSANLKEKNYMAINAAYGKPIIVNTPDGKEIKLKDYTYTLVTPNVGNNQLIIQVKQPDVVLDRNMALYSIESNVKMITGYNEDMHRATQDKISINKLTNFGEYSDRASKPFYNSNVQVPVGASFKKGIKMM